MKKRWLSTGLALCLCIAAIPNAYALQEDSPPQEELFIEEFTAEPVPYEEVNVPTYQEVYAALIAMEEKYPEGMKWTNDTPYSDGSPYRWNGGPLGGANIEAVGCAAFAFELSDQAFGNLSARMLSNGAFAFADVKVGDILRLNNDAHTVIVLQVSDAGVVIAEGNYNDVVHWRRTLSKAEVEAASHYITRYPAGYVSPDDPSAGGVSAEGTTGALSWTLTNAGTLTISGSGAMPDYSGPSEQPWYAYATSIQKIVVGDGVTSIGNSSFYGCAALSVTISNSVTSIGSSAFYGSSLMSVSIPASVKTIGSSAFYSCANLSSVTIAEGLETIGQKAFYACQKLGSITLPASIGSVEAAAFFQCTELKSAVFTPSSKQVTVGEDLFAGCWKLSTVTLPQKMDQISERMFQNCYVALSQLNIPQGTTSIGGSAFASCSCLSTITIPDSVETIGTAAFSACSALKDIYFGGSEAQWNSITKTADIITALENVTIHYNSSAPDTAPDPGTDPAPGTDPNPGTDPDPGTDSNPGTTPAPGHTHSWAAAWSSNATHHWHNCTASGCPVADNSQKEGYAPHVYDSRTDTTCNICGYVRTVGSDSSSDSSSSGSSGGGSSNTSTTRNPDGSTTSKTEDKASGTITETTKSPDGSQTVVETQKDGTVTTTQTDTAGNKTETVEKPDGSSVTSVTQKDGTTAVIRASVSGQIEAEVALSAAAAGEAQRSGETIALPIPEVRAVRDTAAAPAVTIKTGSAEPVKVEIPIENLTSGTVAVIVNADGSEEVVKATIPTEDGIAVALPDGATVKIVDNSKSFTDVTAAYWASGAINFTSARELFAGTTATTFSPDATMTRAMLMTILARFAGEDTSSGSVWYEKAMDWAVANGISDGSNPDSNVTREQLATMLWRYSGSPASSGTLNAFTDAGAISGYAQEAMRWAVEQGIINGFSDGQLGSGAQVTRAQAATMLMRYISGEC